MRFIVSVLILVAVAVAGLYIWNTYMYEETPVDDEAVVETMPEEVEPVAETEIYEPTTEGAGDTETTPVSEETVTVDTSTLNEDQRQLLQTFGIDTNTIEVTADMIACAEEKIGKERLEEITSGALPGFLESLSLMACYGQ